VETLQEDAVPESSEGALHAAFERHYVQLVRFATILTGSQERAEDLVQEGFVRAAERLKALDDREAGLYLRAAVLNIWRSRMRRLGPLWRAQRALAMSAESTAPGPDSDVLSLWTAVLHLPPRQRACIVLRYYEDLTESEVARVLGCSVGTVKQHASRAIRRLREELVDED
jgi:RNA polymerase sigma-70 factor (sigma-E family)